MEPQIQYVRSADGTNIAYTVIGEGVPMIFSPNTWCHLGIQLTDEAGDAWQRIAGEGIMVVPYDVRGMGMSERSVEDFSLKSYVADIEAVRRRLGFDRFALYAHVTGCLGSIAYAADHPERVSHLILSGPFANGEEWYQAWPTLHGLEAFRVRADEDWGLYTLTHATAVFGTRPGADPRPLAALMRECTTPDTLRREIAALRASDVRPLLTEVRAPSLILARRSGARDLAVEAGKFSQEVATGIPGARLALHDPNPAAPGLLAAQLATEFVLGRAVEWPSTASATAHPQRTELPSGTAIILFADIADSTALTERLGDTAFRAKARDLDAALRTVIREHAGTPIEGKLLGDGVLAVFTSARRAIEAALACGRAGDEAGLPLHLGLHAGDVIREDDNVYGGAVNIASRISGLSAPGEILVSDIVRGLARTSAGVTFEDRGEQSLKGIGEAVRVWAVEA